MKKFVHLGVFRKNVGESVFSELTCIYPEGDFLKRGDAFRCVLLSDTPVIIKIIACLARAGFHPWTDHSRRAHDTCEYTMGISREYDPSDFADCNLIELQPLEDAWNKGDRERFDPKGEALLFVRDYFMPKRKYDLYRGIHHSFFVPTRVKELLETSSLSSIHFRPVLYFPHDWTPADTRESVRERHGDPYWELDSDRSMPPLSPSLKLINFKGDPVHRGSPEQGRPVEGLYNRAELHYLQSDLEKMEPPDLARTFERFDNWGAPGDRAIVVSKRFYDFWIKNGLKADWTPVRIDPQ